MTKIMVAGPYKSQYVAQRAMEGLTSLHVETGTPILRPLSVEEARHDGKWYVWEGTGGVK